MDHASAYRQSRERLSDLARDLSSTDDQSTVPASPAWTVRDTYAHLAGAAADVVAGNLQDAGSDAWTAAQVTARAGRALDDILREWAEVGPEFEELIATSPESWWRFVSGTWLHEQDIRAAVGLRGLRNTDGGEVTLLLVDTIADRIAAADLPALRIMTDGRSWTLGDGPPAASLRADRYELARSVGGRRSVEQMAALDWEGDGRRYLPLLATYGPPDDDLID